MGRHADRRDGVVGAQLHIEGEAAGDRVVHLPERDPLFIDAALFQRIGIAPDTAIEMGRLDIGHANGDLAASGHGGDAHLKTVMVVLGGQRRLAACLGFGLVDRLALGLLDHFAGNRHAVDPIGEFRDGGLFRHRKAVERFEIDAVRIVEALLDRRDGITVFKHHADLVIAQREFG